MNELLQDEDTDVRWKAASALGLLAQEGVRSDTTPGLLEKLRNDPAERVRRSADIALKQMEEGVIQHSQLPELLQAPSDEVNEDINLLIEATENAMKSLPPNLTIVSYNDYMKWDSNFDGIEPEIISKIGRKPHEDISISYPEIAQLTANEKISEAKGRHEDRRGWTSSDTTSHPGPGGKYSPKTSSKSRSMPRTPSFSLREGAPLSAAENQQGYLLIFRIEVLLRDLIQKKIIEPNEGTLPNLIPQAIIDKCKEKKEKEEKSDPPIEPSSRWIDYSDFPDLKQILERGKNPERLVGVVSNQQIFSSSLVKLRELEPIRNKIAHSRVISRDEFTRLTLYSKDIVGSFKAGQKRLG